MLDVGEGPKAKNIKNGSFKNMHILHKIDHNSKILLFVGKILFHIRILQVILHLIHQKLGPNKGDTYNNYYRTKVEDPKIEISILRVRPHNMYTN